MKIQVKFPAFDHPLKEGTLILKNDVEVNFNYIGSFNWIGEYNGKKVKVFQESFATDDTDIVFKIDPYLERYNLKLYIIEAINKAFKEFD